MLVMILETAPASLKGELPRWLVQVRPGIFVGRPGKRIRDEFRTKACGRIEMGTVTQLWTSRCEQGYLYRQHGVKEQIWLDFEGLGIPVKLRRENKTKPATA